MKKNPIRLLMPVFLLGLISAVPASRIGPIRAAESGSDGEDRPACLTESFDWESTEKDASACAISGTCDTPEARDASIPSPEQPFVTIRALVHILANDDGSSPVTNRQIIDAQMNTVNDDFALHRIRFQWYSKVDSSTQFRDLAQLNGPEAEQMKAALAVQPSQQLNMYVTNTNPSGGTGVPAFFGNALSPTGGIVVDDFWFYGGGHLLTHEVGHVLGLYHTHRGVSEVSFCSSCYERADGVEADVRGDFCADTPPTPVNFNCTPPGGIDACSGVAWGVTMLENYMGYAPQACVSTFTQQQAGRMHCWTQARLTGWFACELIQPPVGGDSLGDYDNDGWGIASDNCPYAYNPCQEDADSNGVGDVCICMCDCDGDPACDGIKSDVVDVVSCLSVAFRGAGAIEDPNPNCPAVVSDVNCSGATDILDVVKVINVAFRGASPAAEYCDPCSP
jgi:hypothetical protein